MDPFENLPETPDLSGQVTPLSYRPVFSGPYSCVYRGKLRSTGEIVAIKVLNAVEGSALHTMRRKLNRERRTWGALNHPNILPLYGFADDEDMFQPFGALISPWLQHGDASRFLAEHGDSLTLDQRVDLWTDVVAGVGYLHSHNPLLVHGDEAIPTAASDIHAVGCIGLEVIFSQPPYSTRRNNYGGSIYVDIRNGVTPAERPSDLSSYLEVIWSNLESCWDRDPSKRPTANDLQRRALGELPLNFTTNPSINGLNTGLERTSPMNYLLDVPGFGSIPAESSENSRLTLNMRQFAAHQRPVAQKIYSYLDANPGTSIPSSLITSELYAFNSGRGWCLIGQCKLDRAAEKLGPWTEESVDTSKSLDDLYDHIRDEHFGSCFPMPGGLSP